MPLIRYVRFLPDTDGPDSPYPAGIQTSERPFPVLQDRSFTDNIRITLSNGYFVCGHEVASPGYTINTKANGLYFHYVEKGRGTYNGRQFRDRDVFVIRPASKKSMIADVEEPWELFWCVWKGEVAKSVTNKLSVFEDDRFYSLDESIALGALFRYMIYNVHQEKRIEKLVASFTEMLLSECRTVDRDGNPPHSDLHADTAVMIQKYIDEHFRTATVEEIARVFHYNRRYLSSLFREQTGGTLQDSIQDAKLRYAEACLLEGNLSVEKIALSSGYSNYSTFIKAFKKKFGMTPSGYIRFYTQL